ncbi:MAG: 23S rRNA (adenine(2030)-N(6))-methyltransferase RlmJ [Pseudomonadota bacterium]|nr:23S rRNA (adenine(2030)-N(6))-methyltransferase RlmJ [Pseudomonadota bacterium]
MFGYRHNFHAGNYADVVKHVVLISLLQALQQKPKPFYLQDSHGGIGRYDLMSDEAQKNGEYLSGISRLWQAQNPPVAVQKYLEVVRSFNSDGELRYYPGSPRLGRALLRENDRMVITELNKVDCETLRHEFKGDRQVMVQLQDGYQGIKAYLPPAERRGLVLIDPAYELKDEYERLIRGLQKGYRRWPTGIYAIWYPLMSSTIREGFFTALKETGIRKILAAELTIKPLQAEKEMCGSGMIIINAPWQLDQQLKNELEWLWPLLSDTQEGGVNVEWLVPE